ncbi:flagellar basal body L-ring protein FlgH [Magnetococcales bacterium HHB-1]
MVVLKKRIGLLILSALVLSGCGMTRATQRPAAPSSSLQGMTQQTSSQSKYVNKGGLWQHQFEKTVFRDSKASQVGDLITVSIAESSMATNSANTKLEREGDTSFSLTGLFDFGALIGAETAINAATMSSTNNHEGKANTDRSSSFVTSISCIVTEVLANGNLRIEGRKDLTINHENQYIILSGIIRPQDISNANVVRSPKIADARIEFSGEGDMNDQQRPSWLNRLYSAVRIL